MKRKLTGYCVIGLVFAVSLLLLLRRPPDVLISFLESTYIPLKEPVRAFGKFHFLSLGIGIVIAILAGFIASRISGRNDGKITDTVAFSCGVVFAFAELYKQALYLWVIGNGTYQFSVFPFQFCSLPIYLCLLAPLSSQKVKKLLYSFLCLFGTVGGYLVLGYPDFANSITMCIYSMAWHILMVSLGVFLLFSGVAGTSWKRDVLGGGVILAGAIALATGCNLLLSRFGDINLYYMSPYHKPTYLIVKDVYGAFGWLPSVICYWLMFLILGATPLFLFAKLLRVLKKSRTTKYEERKQKNPENSKKSIAKI